MFVIMKRNKIIFGLILSLISTLYSCKSSVEKDAQKIAELKCESKELLKKISSGDMSVIEDSKNLGEKITQLSEEMDKKYTSDEDQKAFFEALKSASAECD